MTGCISSLSPAPRYTRRNPSFPGLGGLADRSWGSWGSRERGQPGELPQTRKLGLLCRQRAGRPRGEVLSALRCREEHGACV